MNTTSRDPLNVPSPVRFNLWKHHAAAIRSMTRAAAERGPDALAELPRELVVIGADLMDMYTGELSPRDVSEEVMAAVRAEGVDEPEAFREWVTSNGGYRVVTASDTSVWALRGGGEADRFVHVHPGRWTPLTVRVRANVLKTAVMVTAYAAVHGGDRTDVELVNRVRSEYLGFPPVREVARDEGLGVALGLLTLA